jgi:hypothetical protein
VNKLKKLAVSFTLMCVLAVTAFGDCEPAVPGQIPPPCACAPGETSGPPCSSQSVNDDSTSAGEILTPPALPTVGVTDISEAVLWALSLF